LSVDGGAFTSPSAFGDILTEANEASDPLFTFTTIQATLVASDFTVSGDVHTYTGTAKTATVTANDEGVGTLTGWSYYTTSTPSEAVTSPTNAGTYDIKVTAAASTDYLGTPGGGLKVGTLTINKATLAEANIGTFLDFEIPDEEDDDIPYDGDPHPIAVGFETPFTNEGAAPEVSYYLGETALGEDEEPTNAGTYTVKVSLAGTGQNFEATAEALTLGTFTIAPGTPTAALLSVAVKSTGVEVTFADDDEEDTEDDANFGALTVKYTKGEGEAEAGFPTEAGDYTVSVSIAAGTNNEATDEDIDLGLTVTVYQVTFDVKDEETAAIETPTVIFNGVTKSESPYSFTYIYSSIEDEAEEAVLTDDIDYGYTVAATGYQTLTVEDDDAVDPSTEVEGVIEVE
jgi:hypothetical protein